MASISQNVDNIGQTTPAISNPSERDTVEKLGNFIKITDSDEASGLTNFCYVNDPKVDDVFTENVDTIKQCRGVVFDGQKVVMKAFSYTNEYGLGDPALKEWFARMGGLKNCRFFDSHEGALIRMFYYAGKWWMTTHRKLNAFKSKWGGGESYGTTFKAALKNQIEENQALRDSLPTGKGNFYDSFQSILKQDSQYMFLVRNTSQNRLVCDAPDKPEMFHVGTFNNGVLDVNDQINVNQPNEHGFDSEQELIDHVNKCDPKVTAGLIVFGPGNNQVKISSDAYLNMSACRGNQPSIKFRFLQIRMDPDTNRLLRKMYPENVHEFDEYEEVIGVIGKNIHNAYMSRFIHKQFTQVPQAEYAVIRQAHQWFIDGRHEDGANERKVTLNVIRQVLDEQKATSINQMIKRIKHESFKKAKEEQENADNVDMSSGVDEFPALGQVPELVDEMDVED